MNEKPINLLYKEEKSYLKPKKTHRKIQFWALLCLIIFFVGCSVYAAMPATLPEDPAAYDPQTLEPIAPENFFGRVKSFIFNKEKKLEGSKDDRINILLLGIGGYGHDGGSLADTIMLVSVKPSTEQIAIISFPRDMAVEMPTKGTWKINHATHFGEQQKKNYGPVYMAERLKETFDIETHYYARVDFKAFTDIIDNIGGINVNVTKTFTDYEYPAANFKFQIVQFNKGTQTLTGTKALQFARSRHGNNGEGSDFARAKRQQKVILALKEKIFSFGTLANPVRINKILQTLQTHIATNLELSDIITLLKMAKELNTDEITTLVLDNSEGGYLKNTIGHNGAYLLEPVTGNYDEISNAIAQVFTNDPNSSIKKVSQNKDDTPTQHIDTLEKPDIEIKNGTWRPGLAARAQAKIINTQEYLIWEIGNTNERPHMQSGIYNIDNNIFLSTIVENMAKELNIPIKQNLPNGETSTTGTEILIILGEDYTEHYNE
jgi:polyisoprenyl-teichoic acid--peptidoglycan teichoic acid transferase